jgi:hypothetical protein
MDHANTDTPAETILHGAYPILELAADLRQLLDYFIKTAWDVATGREVYGLTDLEFVGWHREAPLQSKSGVNRLIVPMAFPYPTSALPQRR